MPVNKIVKGRYVGNRIVRSLLSKLCEDRDDYQHYTMNDISIDYQNGLYSKEEMKEFYKLIGYSVNGYEEIWCSE